MTLRNRLAGTPAPIIPTTLPEAMEGIAAAGFKYIELSAVRGRTEHVPLEADARRWTPSGDRCSGWTSCR